MGVAVKPVNSIRVSVNRFAIMRLIMMHAGFRDDDDKSRDGDDHGRLKFTGVSQPIVAERNTKSPCLTIPTLIPTRAQVYFTLLSSAFPLCVLVRPAVSSAVCFHVLKIRRHTTYELECLDRSRWERTTQACGARTTTWRRN